ncbi:MAG: CHASE domain-containing protein [Rhodocyclaceae bacterium]|nr:CHASE domain-containing protein [Rhodocyclaceae bacterium]
MMLLSRKLLAAWAVLLLSLACTLIGWQFAARLVEARAKTELDAAAASIENAIRRRMTAYEQVLHAGAALFAASGKVERAEWRDFVAHLKIDQHFPGIQGIGFAQHIAPAELAAHVRAVRADVLTQPGTEHFIVIADTEPLKRLRHSHIVEVVLIEEVKKATDLIVERVFWRFPLPAREGAALVAPHHADEPPSAVVMDPYLEQGLKRLHAPEGLEVHEDSWAHFQEAMHTHQEARQAEPPPN